MCGLAGVFRFDRDVVSEEDVAAVAEMGAVQAHRGPDDSGIEQLGACVLASQRLSILDLSPRGHMPMFDEDRSRMLVHNGEIYNYVELRSELQALGHRFRSDGDTEVILRAYEAWGERCQERFVGMWAFALYDHRRRALFLSRDRLGIKPLYVHQDPRRLVFASEIKALVAYLRRTGGLVAPNEASLATYAATGLVDGLEETFFASIRRFPSATCALVSADGGQSRQYWDLPEAARARRDEMRRERDGRLFERVRETLDEAVRVHLRSDVPVGVCLSGGLDSSAVVGLASRHLSESFGGEGAGGGVKTFTVYFADGAEYDERPHAHAVARAFPVDAHEQLVEPGDLLATLRRIVWHLDEPSLALGVYPQWHVMELAHRSVKVVLDGQGGDEIFGGYDNYLPQHLYGLLPKRPLGFLRELLGTLSLYGRDRALAAGRSAVAMRLKQPVPPSVDHTPDAALLAPDLRSLADISREEWRLWPRVFDDWLSNVLYWETTRTRLPALLRYEDRLSMAFSIESRVPFLDHRLVELAFALPDELKRRDGWSKYALRRAMEPVLPREVVWRRDKKGFPTPLGAWLRDERGAPARALLRDPGRRSGRYFSQAALDDAIARHESGRVDRSWQLWRALSVELWLDAFAL